MSALCGFDGIDLENDATTPYTYEVLGNLAGDSLIEVIGRVAAGGAKSTIYGPLAKTKLNQTVAKGKLVAKRAALTAQRGMQIAEAVAKRAAGHKPAQPVAGKAVVVTKKPVVPGRRAVLGAVAPGKMTAKQKAAVAKHDKAGARVTSAAKSALDKAKKAAESAKRLVEAVKKQEAAVAKARKKRARVRGIGADVVADVIEVFGLDPAEVLDALSEAGVEVVGEESSDWPASEEMPGTAATPGFTLRSEDPARADSEVVHDLLAAGGILYDGSRGYPPGWLGSKGYFYDTTKQENGDRYGLVLGGNKTNPAWPGENPTAWTHVHGRQGRPNWWDERPDINLGNVQRHSLGASAHGIPYGPVIGNPSSAFSGGDFAGLKVDDAGNVGWLPGDAPAWATAEINAAAALTAQAEAKARADAQAALDAAKAQEEAEREAERARQEAAQALAEQAAASEAAIEEQRQVTQRQAQDLEEEKRQRELAAEQMRVDLEAQRAAIEMQRQQAQADAEAAREQARADAEYRQAMAQQAQQAPPYQQPYYPPPQPPYGGGGGGQPQYEEEYAEAEAPAPEESYEEEYAEEEYAPEGEE